MSNSIFAESNDPAQPMPPKKIKFRGREYPSVRVYKSDFIESLTHAHPILPLLFWAPIIGFIAYKSSILMEGELSFAWQLGFAGLLTWTFTEYWLHRIFFHPPMTTDFNKRMYLLLHGLHHEAPQDPTRLVMPPAASLIIGAVFWSIFRQALGPVFAYPFFGGFALGYLVYDYIHYATHHFRMKGPVGKLLKGNHMYHHFVNHDTRLGLSSPLWDYVFGTMEGAPAPAAVKEDKPA